jgi:hypothetical protein
LTRQARPPNASTRSKTSSRSSPTTSPTPYVFLGKPPKRFGLAWIHDGKVTGLNTLIKEHGVSPAEIEKVIEELRQAYIRHQDEAHFTTRIEDRTVVEAHFTTRIEDRTVVVTPSQGLEQEVHEIVEHIAH